MTWAEYLTNWNLAWSSQWHRTKCDVAQQLQIHALHQINAKAGGIAVIYKSSLHSQPFSFDGQNEKYVYYQAGFHNQEFVLVSWYAK